MPYSYGAGKEEILEFIRVKLVNSNSSPYRILDIGAGYGTYGRLLKGKLNDYEIDGIDAMDYPTSRKYYNFIDLHDATDLDYLLALPVYDMIILGDILEHFDVETAVNVLAILKTKCNIILIAVPYKCRQSGKNNHWEEHKQPDLTHDVFQQRYPDAQMLLEIPLGVRRIYAYWKIQGELE